MKRKVLIKKFEEIGCTMIRHGAMHDWSRYPVTGMFQPVPKHNEINDFIAKQIIKRLYQLNDHAH